MTDIKPIRTEADHAAAVARIDAIMDASPDSPEADELAVLAELVEGYEKRRFPIEPPSPVDAIRFCMEQKGLTPRDLEPVIGARGKVSEILAGKKPLTLAMIRALNIHLGIPAAILLQREAPSRKSPTAGEGPALDWRRFPLRRMIKLGWLNPVDDLKARAEELVGHLVEAAGGLHALPRPLFRREDSSRRNAKSDQHALQAWCLKAIAIGRAETLSVPYRPGSVDPAFLRRVAQLSAQADGPRRAKAVLAESGIHLVSLRHLPRTYLDGAALRVAATGAPIVALTLRHDRIDNFWFCLLHELAHVGRHLGAGDDAFLDDLTLRGTSVGPQDRRETEADEWAEAALIPAADWAESGLGPDSSVGDVIAFAQSANVHPAIVAGRIRYEHREFRRLSMLLGHGGVRKQLAPV